MERRAPQARAEASPPGTQVQAEREAQFVRNMGAFVRREFDVIDQTMRPDVVLTLPGSSWLAGTYRGFEQVSRSIIALRQAFDSDERVVTFLHEGDQLIVRHAITVSGPHHEVEMILCVKITYDQGGKFASIDVEPADTGLFDYVLNTRLNQPSA